MATTLGVPSDLPTPDPPPVAAETTPPEGQAAPKRELAVVLRRLSRAVQQASIYPQDHPSVREAVDSWHDIATPILKQGTLSVIIARERLLAAHGTGEAAAYVVPWLSTRLHDRGIASLTLDGALDRDGGLRLMQFLAASGQITDADVDGSRPGVRVTRFDCSRARFRDQPNAATAMQSQAEFVWGAIANALAADWCVTRAEGTGPPTPPELADQIRASINEREGTGVSELTTRLIAQGDRLAQLPEAVRNIVRQKLAQFVSQLAPELRGQLLRPMPGDSPEKLNLLVELVDALPSHDMLEILQNVDLTSAGAPRQFVVLLRKLVVLAASNARSAPAGEAVVDRSGLPIHLLHAGHSELRELFEGLFRDSTDGGAEWIPEAYQARIDQLAHSLDRQHGYALDDLADPSDPDVVCAEVNHLALHLLEANPDGEGSDAYLRRLRDQAPRELDARRLTSLGEVAAAVERLAARRPVSGSTARLAEEYIAFCGQRHTLDAVLEAIEETNGAIPEPLVTLVRMGGVESASATATRIVRTASDGARDRLAAALVRLPAGMFDAAIQPLVLHEAELARALLKWLPRVDRDRGLELAQSLTGHASADVRLGALELLFRAPASASRFDKLLRQALDDPEPRIVEFGVDRACARKPVLGIPAMTAFLSATRDERVTPLQRRIIDLLRDEPTTEAHEALAKALSARRRTFDAASLQVSVAIQRALQACADDSAKGAARAWRRSMAGMWSWLLHSDREAS